MITLAARKEMVAYTERNNSACWRRSFQNRPQLGASNFFKARKMIYLKQVECLCFVLCSNPLIATMCLSPEASAVNTNGLLVVATLGYLSRSEATQNNISMKRGIETILL